MEYGVILDSMTQHVYLCLAYRGHSLRSCMYICVYCRNTVAVLATLFVGPQMGASRPAGLFVFPLDLCLCATVLTGASIYHPKLVATCPAMLDAARLKAFQVGRSFFHTSSNIILIVGMYKPAVSLQLSQRAFSSCAETDVLLRTHMYMVTAASI